MSIGLIEDLRAVLPAESIITDPTYLACYSYDAKVVGSPPLAAVRARSEEDVRRACSVCYVHRAPIVPRGASTGMAGGAVPVMDSVMIDLSRMHRIIEIDRELAIAIVEPGVFTGDLQKEAEKFNLMYAPDPASAAISTIGGNVATNAGGLRAVKYGVTGDYVMALRLVLADGRVLSLGRKTKKSVVGLNLVGLVVGSEGTLGIITQITLRLIPLPPIKRTMAALFDDLETAVVSVTRLLASETLPSALELMDAGCIEAVRGQTPDSVLPRAGLHMLLIEVDGDEVDVNRDIGAVTRICKESGAAQIRLAENKNETDELWAARRAISSAIYKISPVKVAEDVVVPINKAAELIREISHIGDRLAFRYVTFGHAGDGNFHVNILCDTNDAEYSEKAEKAREDLYKTALKLGGSISGEHGVGSHKLPYFSLEIEPQERAVMKKVKEVFDPLNLMNPMKAY